MRRFLTVPLLMVSAAHPAGAQTTEDPAAVTLPPIVIERQGAGGEVIDSDGYVAKSSRTATKTDTPLMEVPQSISTITQQQLDDRNPQSLSDALNYTPGTRIGAYGFDPRYDAFFVRGFPATYNGIFRDGLRQYNSPSGIFRTEPYGLEGITILKGPASMLYGASNGGGLVDLITKRPTETALNEIEVQAGNHDRYQTNFDFSGPVTAKGDLLFRMTGLLRDSDTELAAVPDDRVYLAPALTWKPGDDTTLTLLGEFMDATTGGTAAYYNDANGITDYFGGDPRFNDFEQRQHRIGYEFEHRFDETFTVRQNFRYGHLDTKQQYVYITGREGDVFGRATGLGYEDVDTVVVDTQGQADFSTGPVRHTLLAGVDVGYVKYDQSSGFGLAPDLDAVTRNYGAQAIASPDASFSGGQKQWLTGVYLQDQLKLGGWSLTLGARQDWVSTETTSPDFTTGGRSTRDQSDHEFTGRAGLSYQTGFGLAPYVSYSTSFTPNVGTGPDGAAFKATTAEQKEIGVKFQVPNRNAMITASLFDIEQENGVFFEVVDGVNTEVQRGRLRSRGFELEGTATLDNGINLIASYAYTDLEIEEGAAGTTGKTLSSTPFHTASIWADYKVMSGFAEGFGLGAGVRYTGSSYGDDRNTIDNEARTLVDLAVHYDLDAVSPKLEGVRLQVNATNLLDETKVTCSSAYCYRDAGRTVIGSVRYRW
ncbi:ferrichrome-iron receptor [Skermanella stibiiresistens SB22]|uniref:Ferrichrome-iron receptor n=1 Tax=Skermanella stibiiresistens SB22 TaxID=1385369 RepID=W9H8J3_9PROT|nr:TonB-dependent siderophore receptor [Skermanella stibiiresistens]EWY42575.1 ferrichrome-iron receptor [Skermanella stibiiresistens SB22]